MAEIEDIAEESFSGTRIGDVSFVEALSNYYSDFLSTDFKKGQLPKRKFAQKDNKGRRAGIPLGKFPKFEQKARERLVKEIGNGITFQISFGTYKSELSQVTKKGILKAIKSIDLGEFAEKLEQLGKSGHKQLNAAKNIDLEAFQENFLNDVHRIIASQIGSHLIDRLEPVFEKSSSNLLESLIGLENEIAALLSYEIEEGLPTAIADTLMSEGNPLQNLLVEALSQDLVLDKLEHFFDEFSAGDLHTELGEMLAAEKLSENLEFYCYLGELKYRGHSFPIAYVPFKIVPEKSKFNITFDTRLLFNKRAIDYLAKIAQEQTNLAAITPLSKRINYLDNSDSICSEMDRVIQDILLALNVNGDLSFQDIKRKQQKNSIIQVTNNFSFALFDKSDESMLSDFEELLTDIVNGGEIFQFIQKLIDSFLTENPISIDRKINDAWEELELPEKLVFEAPLPLAEEQRKILDAVKNKKSRFISVEGPPGTGKSHTISAIIFDAILSGKSTLVLSDKLEALDVVESKLNGVLSAVRPGDDFVNPILRLGRAGNNFNKILRNQTIEKLRTQSRVFEDSSSQKTKEYKNILNVLKADIGKQVELSSAIDLNEIRDWGGDKDELLDHYDDDATELFLDNGNDKRLILKIKELREQFLKGGPEANILSSFVRNGKSKEAAFKFFKAFNPDDEVEFLDVLDRYPSLNSENYYLLDDCFAGLRDAAGIFGYLFAGDKIRIQIRKLTEGLGAGIKGGQNVESIKTQLKNDFDSCETFFQLFPKLAKLDTQLLRDRAHCDDAVVNSFKQSLKELEGLIASSNIEVTMSECCEIIFSDDDDDTAYYFDLAEIIEREIVIKQQFEIPDYNYLAQKSRLESYNAQRLANEIDKKVVSFAEHNRADRKELSSIIRKKARFPRDKFETLITAFPCMICSLRDYAEYIPLEQELFDLIIIDEASQVSIAQALPAIVRAKKLLVLGDRKQFGNVKTANASKETNSGYFQKVMSALSNDWEEVTESIEERAKGLNISSSVMDFMETVSNYNIMLKKHFRGYPEMISFSSKYFYGNSLQPMKIRGHAISDVLEFHILEPESIDPTRNTNSYEAEFIVERMVRQLEEEDFRSVCIITPFTEQQTYISRLVSDHKNYSEFISKLKFRCFTFDSCQGEERDIIYYSFVASDQRDRLSYIFPKHLTEQDEEELDRNLRLQRLNVGFSRGKEKLVFVLSKPVEQLSSSLRDTLNHYQNVLETQKSLPSAGDVDQSSEMEKEVLSWLKACSLVLEGNVEIQTQFPLGEYLKSIDPQYNHPAYTVDFLLRIKVGDTIRNLIIEYDGFDYHFSAKDQREVNEGNWEFYLTEKDVEREKTLESYGYKMLRVNKFNIGDNPINELDERIRNFLEEFDAELDTLTKETKEKTRKVLEGDLKLCRKCGKHKPLSDFKDPTTSSGTRRLCASCKKESVARSESFMRGRRRRRY